MTFKYKDQIFPQPMRKVRTCVRSVITRGTFRKFQHLHALQVNFDLQVPIFCRVNFWHYQGR